MTLRIQLPERPGPRPEATRPSREQAFPHKQTSQNAPPDMQEALFRRAAALPGVTVGDSLVSVPGARAFHLDPALARGPARAFQRGREFAHIHPVQDGSLHATLPPDLYQEVLDKGWGEPHPVSGTMMLWGPRDEQELEIVWTLVRASYAYATGGNAS
jgi:phospholipase/carboxylesterase